MSKQSARAAFYAKRRACSNAAASRFYESLGNAVNQQLRDAFATGFGGSIVVLQWIDGAQKRVVHENLTSEQLFRKYNELMRPAEAG